jgi:hypothetical protein
MYCGCGTAKNKKLGCLWTTLTILTIASLAAWLTLFGSCYSKAQSDSALPAHRIRVAAQTRRKLKQWTTCICVNTSDVGYSLFMSLLAKDCLRCKQFSSLGAQSPTMICRLCPCEGRRRQ